MALPEKIRSSLMRRMALEGMMKEDLILSREMVIMPMKRPSRSKAGDPPSPPSEGMELLM